MRTTQPRTASSKKGLSNQDSSISRFSCICGGGRGAQEESGGWVERA